MAPWKFRRRLLLVLPSCTLLCFSNIVPQYQVKEENLPRIVLPQPIPFSHKAHSSLGLTCQGCHPGASVQERAGFPTSSSCMYCHKTIRENSSTIQKLNILQRQKKNLAWVRVYQVPDFVFFSHARHVNAKLSCQTCHGPVQNRDVLAQEISTNMEMCMNCHKSSLVSTECHSCHELGE